MRTSALLKVLRGVTAASLTLALLPAVPRVGAAPVSVLTFHNDNLREGANTNETVLTPDNVKRSSFGKLFSQPVDGYVYAQPLIMAQLAIPGKGVHNVVFVATEHDSIYAFDADSNAGADGGLLWHVNLGIAAKMSPDFGARYHPEGNTDMVPEAGITGTPVIDPVGGTLYVDVFTHEGTNYFHRIHALNVATGEERPFSPALVAASVPGTGLDSVNGVETFNARQHLQRPALTLAGGILYVPYGSHADTDPYHGWIIGFNAANLQLLTNYAFNTTPNATVEKFGPHAAEGALWMGGGGICADAANNLYFEVGNGSFSADTGGGDYGDSFVKLSTVSKLAVADYFTPFDQAAMQESDNDLGSGGPMLLPDSAGSAAHPHLIVGAGKYGHIYLVDCDDMGKYNASNDNQIVQKIPGAIGHGGSYAVPAWFNNRIYYTGWADNLKAFAMANGRIIPAPVSMSPTSLGPFAGSPAISANGISNGIVWVVDPGAFSYNGPEVLHAYSADNLAQELYNSSQSLDRDNPGGAVKMTTPTVANGKVYVGAEYKLSVYGVQVFLDTPLISPAGGNFTNSVMVTLADADPGASLYYTDDGTTPTTDSTLYTGPFELRSSTAVQAIATKPGAVNSGIVGVSFVNVAALGNGTGLVGAYYSNQTGLNPFTGAPALVRTDATVNFKWGADGPDPAVEKTNFAVRWIGSVQPQFSETYTFSAVTGDAVRLYVNNQLLIDDWEKPPANAGSNTITLRAQQLYNLQLDCLQRGDHAGAQLAWSSPSTPSAIIPRTQLYPFTNAPPTVAVLIPANDSRYTASASVTIGAEAGAPFNPLADVAFFANNTFLGRVGHPPYVITATGLNAGSYALTAVATDGSGLSRTSAPVKITVARGRGRRAGLERRVATPAFLNLPSTFNGALPRLLSRTGIFRDTSAMTPADGMIPYAPNAPLWADGAQATCYFAVPGDGGVITPDQQISFAPTGGWKFPEGTVFVKTFELNTDAAHPSVKRRLETQVLVRDTAGQVYGITYKWRADNSDADLLLTGKSEDIPIRNATGPGTQTWYYCSPTDCRICHTPAANYVLGVNTRQLNGTRTYAATGVADNQIRALNRIGLLNPAPDEAAIAGFEKLSSLKDPAAPLEVRVRSYLDANCAECHRPGVVGGFDLRYGTPVAAQKIINVPAAFNLGHDHAELLMPRDITRSVIYDRLNTANPSIKMPPLGRNLIDSNAIAIMSAWINSLPVTPVPPPSADKPNPYE
jgi:hypothetical protein